MTTLDIATGDDAVAPAAHFLDGSAFGVRFDSYRNFGRFESQIDPSDPGLIVWPGGHLAETRTDRYGLEYDDLSNPVIDRPGLDEMMAAAIARDAALSITLPTVRYLGREAELTDDLRGFLGDLLSGGYGPLPQELILEVGSEYYAHFTDGATPAAAQYAGIADLIVTELALALNDPTVNLIGADVTIAVQAGKTLGDDEVIRDGLSDFALSNVEMVIHHRFSPGPEAIDPRIPDVEQIIGNWETEVVDAGGTVPELFVSAWNVAQYTRSDALDDFLELNPSLTADDVDLDRRTNASFEQFWQASLDSHAYGERHPGLILEIFSSYAEAGMSAGAVFGTDVVHPGRLSWRDDQQADHTFVGGETIRMIYESLEGTRALASNGPYDSDDAVMPYAFEGADRVVVFLAAGAQASGEITLDVEGLGSELTSLWADSLRAIEDPDWMETFAIPDNPEVDESPEAATFLPGQRSAANVEVIEGGVRLSLAAYEVIRLSFAKTAEGADALQAISSGDEIDLTTLAADDSLPTTDPVVDTIDYSAPGVPHYGSEDDGEDGLGLEMLALLLPIFFLM